MKQFFRLAILGVPFFWSAAMGAQTSPADKTTAATDAQPAIIEAPKEIPPLVQSAAQNIAHTIVQRKKTNSSTDVFPGSAPKLFLFAVAAAADPEKAKPVNYAAKYITAAETQRTDKQVGSSAGTSGSTSAVDKPGLPYLLGLAIEHGAINQNINGSTLDLSSSPYALIAAFKNDTAQTYHQYSGFTRIGVSAAYDLQDQNDPLASVRRKQLSEWSVKLRILGDHSPRSKAAQQLFIDKVLPVLEQKALVSGEIKKAIFTAARDDIFSNFEITTNKSINDLLAATDFDIATAEDRITKIITDSVQQNIYAQLGALNFTSADQALLSTFLIRYKAATDAYTESANAFDDALKALALKPTLTLAYFNERGSGTPNYSVVKLLFEKKPQGFMQIDANVSASAYSNPDRSKNEQTFRDAVAALGLQQNLGRSPFLTNDSDKSQISVNFSGRYERLQENRHIPGKKADIAVANWKLEIPIGAGVSLPISITYANASELINETDVRGNFGITFDLDKLRVLASPK